MKTAAQKVNMLLFGAGAVILIILDQITKAAAREYLQGGRDLVLIKGVFELHYLENRGSAFGMLQGKQTFFIIMAVLVLFIVPYLYSKIPCVGRFFYLRLTAVLFLSGALGNAVDRIVYGYVTDFFYFSLIDFPVFNVADIYVTVATCALILLVLFYYSDEDFEQIRL